MPSRLRVPNVEVIGDDGEPVNPNVMNPSVMQFVMLASIASQAVRIRRYFDDRKAEGLVENFALNITPAVQEVFCAFPSQTFFIVNDGPGQIFVRINDANQTETPLLITENMFLNFETHELVKFYVRSAPATVATARAMARR